MQCLGWLSSLFVTSSFSADNTHISLFVGKMGNWKLEVGRMAMYMSFPVILFHYFNHPTYFEEWVTKTKREIFPPENHKDREAIQELIKEMRKKQMRALEGE